jgi:hypothetical protein
VDPLDPPLSITAVVSFSSFFSRKEKLIGAIDGKTQKEILKNSKGKRY